jgi:uncharacterized protein (TIRG00374 family)
MGCQYLSSYRWQILLKAHDISVSVNRLFSFYLVGMFFNNFLPTSVGGDVVKGFDLYRHSGKGKVAITTVFLERYTGLAAIIVIGLVTLTMGYTYFSDPMVTILLSCIAVIFFCGTLAVVNRFVKTLCITILRRFKMTKTEKIISALYETFGRYKIHKRLLLYAIVLSFIIQSLNILVYILLANGLGINVPWPYFFLFFPIITIISMLPVSFNGLGMREGMFIYLLGKIDVPSAHALSLSLSWFFIVTCISLFGGLDFITRKKVWKLQLLRTSRIPQGIYKGRRDHLSRVFSDTKSNFHCGC